MQELRIPVAFFRQIPEGPEPCCRVLRAEGGSSGSSVPPFLRSEIPIGPTARLLL